MVRCAYITLKQTPNCRSHSSDTSNIIYVFIDILKTECRLRSEQYECGYIPDNAPSPHRNKKRTYFVLHHVGAEKSTRNKSLVFNHFDTSWLLFMNKNHQLQPHFFVSLWALSTIIKVKKQQRYGILVSYFPMVLSHPCV